MAIPIKDDNPLKVIRFQTVTALLIAINVLAFVATGAVPGEQVLASIATGFGVVPAELLHHGVGGDYQPLYEPLTLITYQFLHGSWFHLLSNMLIMWILADNVEDAFGHWGFLAFYLVCGVVAGLVHALMTVGSSDPLVGASGAIAGVMGAYILLYPRARILMLLAFIIPLRVPAWAFLGLWIVTQFLSLRAAPQMGEQAVAWWAHIGGFAMGLILTVVFRRELFRGGLTSRL
jgi:membrane associated rhomboid family serine protease